MHLAAGPSLGVWTTNENTEEWFYKAILRDALFDRDITEDAGQPVDSWWSRGDIQSERGILLRVDNGIEADDQAELKITELLLYATIEPNHSGSLPTPPASSSASPDAGQDAPPENVVPKARIYALPLSFELLHRYDLSQAPDSPPLKSANDGHGQFLRPSVNEQNPMQRSTRKRSRISSLFDDATQRKRKVRRKGGESVSEVMAGLERLPSSHMHNLSTHKRGHEDDVAQMASVEPQELQTHRRGLSRSSSAASLGGRPLSSRGAIADGKGSSLRRVASIATMDSTSTLPEGETNIGLQNKNALSRIVMAGMRIYGLQQRKKSSRSRAVSEAASSVGVIPQDPAQMQDSDDGYKLVYHQTLKAATFTFRRQIAAKLISQVAMRDIVDRLLALFCTNPLGKQRDSEVFGGDQEAARGHFDPPSGSAEMKARDGSWSTPKVRKRHLEGYDEGLMEITASPSCRVTPLSVSRVV